MGRTGLRIRVTAVGASRISSKVFQPFNDETSMCCQGDAFDSFMNIFPYNEMNVFFLATLLNKLPPRDQGSRK